MIRSTKKRGRPTAVFKAADGSQIIGLFKLADGRWRASGPDKFTFSEPDEKIAIMRFREWESRNAGNRISIPTASANINDARAMADAVQFVESVSAPRPHDLTGTFLPPDQAKPRSSIPQGHPIEIRLDVDRLEFYTNDPIHEAAFWAWLRRVILEKPLYLAERVGIEQLGYLHSLPKPTPSPTLEEVGKLYFDKAKITDRWRGRSQTFWQEFADAVAVLTLREVTQEAVADYKASVLEASDKPTYAKHRFGVIKTIISYSKEWGKWSEDRTKALGYCSILIPPTSTSLDPKPISKAAFHSLLKHADDQMKAMLLIALNCCMYAQDVADLKPNDLDLDKGTLIADRGKTQVARVAVLWPQTRAAIRNLNVIDGVLFRTHSTRQAHNANTIRKAFRDLRSKAELDQSIQFAQIRDGAYTHACEGENVQFEHVRVLAGHRSGITDNYVKRRPQLVSAACNATYTAYGIDKLVGE